MTTAEEKFQHKFSKLREQFVEKFSEKTKTLKGLWKTMNDESWSPSSINDFRLAVHSLIGTAGTFNFTEISANARKVEALVKKLSTQKTAASQAEKEEVEQAIFSLCNKMRIKPGSPAPPPIETGPVSKITNNRILIVDDDIDAADIIKDHLELHSFVVKVLSHPAQLMDAAKQFKPSLVLMDMVFEEGQLAGAAAVEVLRDNNILTPVIFISVNDDMASRLNAIRTGAYSYLTKPIDFNLLTSNIKMACNLKPDSPYRVLIVDDDPDILQLHAAALISDGMSVQALTDPMQTLDEIQSFKPELILLDMHMPECSGLEVALTIRQNSKFDDIPIVFLSSEQDVSIRMMTIKSGSDDFISKPVNIDYLKRAVQARIERSRKLSATRDTDSTAIKKMRKGKELAEHANRAKSEFISKMSHELRTPLNSILGYTQLLELDHDKTLTEQQKSNLAHIMDSGWHLLNLINDVLDISKIESGYLSLVNTEINLNDVIEKSIEMHSKIITDKNITLTYTNNCAVDTLVNADATRLQQVISNIISNAIKFNKDNGKIDVSATIDTDDNCKVIIKDTGIGIPEDIIHELFTPFHRLGREKSTIEGSGIGLALSAQLVQLMDGNIGAHNNEDSGLTFWFSLKQPKKNEQAMFANGRQRSIKILHVEENNMELELIRQSFSAYSDIELFSVRDAESALHVATKISPDIILLDVELSSMDGLTMLNALRTLKHLKNTPIYALSSNDIPKEQQSTKKGEFHCYFSKPYNMSELLQSIDSACTK